MTNTYYDVTVVSDDIQVKDQSRAYILARYTLDHEPVDWEIIERACRDRGYDDTADAVNHGLRNFRVLIYPLD